MTYTAEIADDFRRERDGWAVVREGDERFFLTGLTKGQAEYGALIADADVFPYDNDSDNAAWLEEMVVPTQCGICDGVVFAAQLDTSGRCPECQS